MDGLCNVNVSKNMLSSVNNSHRAYLEHLDIERRNKTAKREKKLLASEKQKRVKKMQTELSKIEDLKKSNKELNVRESKAEQMVQSACAFVDEGNERMAKGLADKDLDQIEAAQRIIELAQEKQKKAKEDMESIHMEKRQ